MRRYVGMKQRYHTMNVYESKELRESKEADLFQAKLLAIWIPLIPVGGMFLAMMILAMFSNPLFLLFVVGLFYYVYYSVKNGVKK